jgi:hypothetical protein
LYSFQKINVLNKLLKDGYYHPFDIFTKDSFLLEDRNMENDYGWGFCKSYEWLKEQMLKQNIFYKKNNQHLIWSYYQWYGKKKIPDKRFSSVFEFYDEPFVMLELEVDDQRVCLSDYSAWHSVLNYWYLDDEKNCEQFINLDERNNYYKNKPLKNEVMHQKLQESWLNIFNMEKCRDIYSITEDEQVIQGTFFELFLQDIKKIHYFENKKCIKVVKL